MLFHDTNYSNTSPGLIGNWFLMPSLLQGHVSVESLYIATETACTMWTQPELMQSSRVLKSSWGLRKTFKGLESPWVLEKTFRGLESPWVLKKNLQRP